MTTAQKLALFTLIIAGYFLMSTTYTSADLFDDEIAGTNVFSMSTLELSVEHSAHFGAVSSLFSIFEIRPTGFDVGALRVHNTGGIPYNYRIYPEVIGDATLCNNLDFEVWQDREDVYLGPLMNVAHDTFAVVDQIDQWIFFLSLNNSDQSLAQKSCTFNLRVRTWRGNPENQYGFWDEKIISNTVTSGSWN